MPKVEFLFDFGSPNAYLCHRVIPAIEQRQGVRFDYVPVLLGGGRPLAPPGTATRRWRLARVESFGGGVAVLEYHALA